MSAAPHAAPPGWGPDDVERPFDWNGWFGPLRPRWPSLAVATVAGAAAGFALTLVLTPLYTSHVTFIPPQQQQGGAAAALASLGALAALGGANAVKSPIDQYVSLMQSDAVTDRLIDQFHLQQVYDYDYRDKTRRKLLHRTSIVPGKKDGLITVEVDDADRARAAALANQYVEELRRLTSTLAVTEAQQRRVFFERQLQESKTRLTRAQSALQGTGFSAGALKADTRASAEGYARLRADLATAEVKLQGLRESRAETAPEVRQQAAIIAGIESQLRQIESSASNGAGSSGDPDYVSRYREFKYQETVFELMAKQYELARVDEAREGALIQVVDAARPAERKSWPRGAWFAGGGAVVGLLAAITAVLARHRRRRAPGAA